MLQKEKGAVTARKWILIALWWLGGLAYFSERWIFGPLIPTLMAEFKIDRVRAGMLGSAEMIGFMLMPFVAGLLSDRVGRRIVILWGLGGLSFFTVLAGFTSSYGQMYTARFLTGLSEPFFSIPLLVLVSELFPQRPGFFVTLVVSGTSLGWFAGPLLSGWLLQSFGDWRLPFWITGGSGLLIAGLLFVSWRGIEKEESGAKAKDRREFKLRGVLWVSLVILSFICLFNIIAEFGFSMWLPAFLKEERGFALVEVGVITSMWGLGQAVGRPLLTLVADRCGYRVVGFCSAVMMALSFYFVLKSQGYGSFVFWQLMAGFLGSAVMGCLWTFTALLFGNLKGTALGIISNIGQLGGAAAPIIVGYLGDRVSLETGLAMIGVVPALVVAVLFLSSFLWVRGDIRRRSEPYKAT